MTDKLIEVLARDHSGRVFDQFFCDPHRSPERRAQWIEKTWKAYMPEARAALTAIREAGYAVVPVEPTEKMLEAGWRILPDMLGGDAPGEVYRAMIAAAQEEGK